VPFFFLTYGQPIHECESEKKESDALISTVKGAPSMLYKCLDIFVMILNNKLSFGGKGRVCASTTRPICTVQYMLDSRNN
jgi:hypothetical protein